MGRGKKTTGEGGGKNSPPSFLPALTLPNSSPENVNFDLFLYSVQPQLPSTGESSYSINMSGGHASIGDHSVTNVGTATPR